MSDAKRLAGLVGPTLAAMVAAEFPSIQPDLYAHQIPPVVYLSGVLMFVGGLAIVRATTSARMEIIRQSSGKLMSNKHG